MRPVYKIELYDAGAVLLSDKDSNYEFTGLDYSYDFERLSLGFGAKSLLQKIGSLQSKDILELEESFDDIFLIEKPLYRRVWCSELNAEELSNGNLRIAATANSSHESIPPYKKGEEWSINLIYRGNYSVFE